MPENLLIAAKTDDGDKPKRKGLLSVLKKKTPAPYDKYSGIIDDTGKTNNNPTVLQATQNMVKYLKNNTPDSNTYRPEHAHTSQNYDKKKPLNTA